MKLTALFLSFAALAGTAQGAAVLYITANTSTVRKSSDDGATFAAWGATGTNLRGIAVNPATGNVFVNDGGAGTATARPLYARSADGTVLSTATYDPTGGFNAQPAGFYNGFAYQNAGTAGNVAGQSTGFAGFNGSTFSTSTLSSANVGNYQMNDMTFATSGGVNYMYYNGAGGNAFNRSLINANGTLGVRNNATLSSSTAGVALPANFNDYALSASGRVLGLGQGAAGTGSSGIWVSDVNQFVANSFSLSQNLAFSATENSATGDMGANAQDFAMVGNDIYAVSNTNLYRYTLNDATGAISFVSANAHGFNSTNVQIAALPIPEPSTFALLGLGGFLVCLRNRRKVS